MSKLRRNQDKSAPCVCRIGNVVLDWEYRAGKAESLSKQRSAGPGCKPRGQPGIHIIDPCRAQQRELERDWKTPIVFLELSELPLKSHHF